MGGHTLLAFLPICVWFREASKMMPSLPMYTWGCFTEAWNPSSMGISMSRDTAFWRSCFGCFEDEADSRWVCFLLFPATRGIIKRVLDVLGFDPLSRCELKVADGMVFDVHALKRRKWSLEMNKTFYCCNPCCFLLRI